MKNGPTIMWTCEGCIHRKWRKEPVPGAMFYCDLLDVILLGKAIQTPDRCPLITDVMRKQFAEMQAQLKTNM